MKLILVILAVSVAAGLLAGGRVSSLSRVRVRWPIVAVLGLALQVAPVSGPTVPLVLLFVSFVLLAAFAFTNIRVAGFSLVLIGIVLNFAVIAVNHGMPVSKEALIRSGQADTLASLINDGGAKHHLAGPGDELVFLGDVIAVPPPVAQAVSVGDLFTFAGVVWFTIAGMLGKGAPIGSGSIVEGSRALLPVSVRGTRREPD